MNNATLLKIMSEDDTGILGDDFICFKKTPDDLFVVVKWEEDFVPVEDTFDFGDEIENKEYLDKFESGEYQNLALKAAYFDSKGRFIKNDYLACVHVSTKDLRKDVETISKDHF